MKKEVILIPARYESSRFPGKPLVNISGIPLVIRVANICAQALDKHYIYVATDDERIANIVEQFGYQYVMTSPNALTGTDRLAEAASLIDADIYINVQGDEPLIRPDSILKILEKKRQLPTHIINGYCEITLNEDPSSKNIPKVIFDEDGNMVYMSRSLIPGYKDTKHSPTKYYKQVCIYAFSKEELIAYGNFGRKSKLEQSEDIEILRFLELGKPIKMVETSANSLAVDTPRDVDRIEDFLRNHAL